MQGVVSEKENGRRKDMDIILGAINLALFVAVTVALVYRYRESRQSGFLWLAVPLVLLPLLSLPIAHWIKASVDRLSRGEQSAMFPFSLVESGRMTLGSLLSFWNGISHIVWSGFVLVGILLLRERCHGQRKT
jgi:hypothetical protein